MAGTKPGIEVEGGPQLRRAFKKLGDRASDLTQLHGDIGEIVEETAAELVPVASGTLRDSIRHTKRKTGATVLAGRRSVPYAGPIHFGWRARNIEPQPFLYDALDSRRDEIAKRYADGIGDLVERFDREAPS
jgi:hypothetical protein